jgi:arginine decarboxylase
VGRLRTDTWNRLRDLSRRLRRLGKDDPAFEQAHNECTQVLGTLRSFEHYHAFPGKRALAQLQRHFDRRAFEAFASQSIRLVRLLTSNAYRRLDLSVAQVRDYADLMNISTVSDRVHETTHEEARPYFEVLIVDELTPKEEMDLHDAFYGLRRSTDEFIYNVVIAGTFEDALVAAAVNFNIQSCLIRTNFPFGGRTRPAVLTDIYGILGLDPEALASAMASERGLILGRALKSLRPELDLFLVTDAPLENIVKELSRDFHRAYYLQEDYNDQHLSILKSVHERFEAPFFSALRRYSLRPTGAFHALPISRGKSIAKSHWIRDMETFYGSNIFQAETSATTGGLDSLLQPQGPLKKAQRLAARAFGADRTYFVTNGTSTANKIVLQALIHPGDIVLLSHDCHKSHPYAVILAGAFPVYLDAYPLSSYSMYGGVSIVTIKRHLLELERAGMLHRVKMILLTNITFDGIAYDPERVMEEILSIKPDVVFVWDEAWYAYGRFWPTLRQRTAMEAANKLRRRYRSPEYAATYEQWKPSASTWSTDRRLEERLLPDPDRVRIRVYVTQSTHKTLTALRQGSMIHVNDQDFEEQVRVAFDEAYMTHTSTSPNYQILASLDVGRRQAELEGYELVHRSIELAMTLREQVHSDHLLYRYFRVLGPGDMVPKEYRPSGLEYYYDRTTGWSPLEAAWHSDEFVLDPTRVTIHVGRTGMDGDTFKKLLMDRFDIQINKTSRNTVLFMINIGVTRGAIAHLVKVLTMIAQELDEKLTSMSRVGLRIHHQRVSSLTEELPPLPNFSRFHPAFIPPQCEETSAGDIRRAFFLACDENEVRYVNLDQSLHATASSGEELVSAGFVTPYPPGFPVLVPGQVVSPDIVAYLLALDVKEIHGYEPGYGLRIFKLSALAALTPPLQDSPRVQRVREGAKAT